MIGILIIAHGSLGESLKECAKHVIGNEPGQLAFLAVNTDDDPNKLLPKAQALVLELDHGDGVLVLSDMYGATPCNIVSKLLVPGKIEGVAGVNMPMIVRTMTYRHESLMALVEKAISGGREGVVHFDRDRCDRYGS
ncbi:MAG: PTS fructose transporter subunit IIA [Methylotenera sp.]|uniref:PTS sugar transporter subunit IIA n=1 Tax=Methylotenera sp. TaxID=2051956 RepID=UPI002723BD0C|nr:PTS fructose transporter subunit IIA [Methylotenera sp.]MDO9204208.1 PTS fructose transporter subunit IIA [Methylotenera sp.]MDO9393607.1 PTS fructose transporter subunit IIA [Methylotenera sp.]MDP1523877.1 PTS fructose transporter subunit IIA [Methylotenera sp.]MDP3308137.1 PTS fructose transporter subunit IIA [Methylotenera sp.]MDP3817704.1 PTS fructose transporter subunit IIA [Methylotenera sp.]